MSGDEGRAERLQRDRRKHRGSGSAVVLLALVLAVLLGVVAACGEDPRPVDEEGEATTTTGTLYGLTTVTDPPGDIYDEIVRDHEQLDELMGRLVAGEDELLEEAFRLFLAHADAEELVFYRPLRQRDDQLDELIDRSIEEHDQMGGWAGELAAARDDPGDFSRIAQELHQLVMAHFQAEEGEIIPRAREILSDSEARSMASQFVGHKQTVLGSD